MWGLKTISDRLSGANYKNRGTRDAIAMQKAGADEMNCESERHLLPKIYTALMSQLPSDEIIGIENGDKGLRKCICL